MYILFVIIYVIFQTTYTDKGPKVNIRLLHKRNTRPDQENYDVVLCTVRKLLSEKKSSSQLLQFIIYQVRL